MHLSAKFVLLLASISVSIASPIYDGTIIDKESAPLLSSISTAEHEIPNNYIVVFKKYVNDVSATEHHNWVADIHESSLASLRKRSQVPLVRTGDDESIFNLDVDSLTGLKHIYNIAGGLLGYSGAFDHTVIDEIRKHPDVSPIWPCFAGAYLSPRASCTRIASALDK
jgi:cerevisin